MADTSNMKITRPSDRGTKAPAGSFAVNLVWEGDSCDYCSPPTRFCVTDDEGKVVGYLESDYRWDFRIPEDVADHPKSPHYVMEMTALDADMREVPEVDTTHSMHLAAAALLRRSREERQ